MLCPSLTGHLAAGNMSNYLPLILQYLGDPQKPQYLLLLSLKEVILTRSSEFAAHIDQVCKAIYHLHNTLTTCPPHPNPKSPLALESRQSCSF